MRLPVPAMDHSKENGYNRDKAPASNNCAQIRHLEICLYDLGLELSRETNSDCERIIMRAMAPSGDRAVGRDQTSDLEFLVDSAPSLIHTSRPDGYLDFFNQTWLTYVGRPLEDLQGWKWTAFIHPDDVEVIVEKWRSLWPAANPSCMKRVSCALTANIAGCCTTKWLRETGTVKLLSGMDRVSILRIACERKYSSAEAPKNCKEVSIISPKDSGLPTWAAGHSILPDSTTGLLNYFGCTVSIRTANRRLFRNIWIVSTHRIAGPWRTSSRDSREGLSLRCHQANRATQW